MRVKFSLILIFTLALLVSSQVSLAQGPVAPEAPNDPTANQGSAFTYQGSLKDSGLPANGNYDFRFRIYQSLSGGSPIGNPSVIDLPNIAVVNGLFAVSLNFGSNFSGAERYLEIDVRRIGTTSYTTLGPRQLLSAAPYAMSLVPGAVIEDNTIGYAFSVSNTAGSGIHATTYNGSGLTGIAFNSTGAFNGIEGESWSNLGVGVLGRASSLSGATMGVLGKSDSANGSGVTGVAMAVSGTTYGVYGFTHSPDGYGVFSEGRLKALAATNGGSAFVENYVGLFENNSSSVGSGPDVLALKIDNLAKPTFASNYIGFFDSSGIIAAVDGNGTGGVTYKTVGDDFAEYFPLLNPSDRLSPGEVVGLYAGQLKRSTLGADQVLVVSSTPGFVGNMAPGESEAGLALVALTGQAPVRVTGPVQAGDWIIPSGADDGTAVAVSPEQITPQQAAQIIGRALESATGSGMHRVRALVGVSTNPAWSQILAQKETRLADLETQLAQRDAQLVALETRLARVENLVNQPASRQVNSSLPATLSGLGLSGLFFTGLFWFNRRGYQ